MCDSRVEIDEENNILIHARTFIFMSTGIITFPIRNIHESNRKFLENKSDNLIIPYICHMGYIIWKLDILYEDIKHILH